MNEPRRLFEGGGDLERSLLNSARDDRPLLNSRRRTLVALGLGTGFIGAGATVSTATAATTVGTWALVKWVGIGVIAGLTVVTTADHYHLVPGDSAQEALAAATTQAAARDVQPIEKTFAPPRAVPAAIDESAPLASVPYSQTAATRASEHDSQTGDPDSQARSNPQPVAVASSEAASKTTESKPKKGAAEKAKAPATATLAEEVSYLDQAQKALSSGNASKALELLGQHDAEFKALRIEAMVLRMAVLNARGDKAGAAALANAFLATYPRSPHANRVRSLLAGATSGTTLSPQ